MRLLGQDYALQDAENNIVYPLKREAYEMVTDLSKQEHLTDSKRINMGNLDVPFDYTSFHEIADDCLAISRHYHPEVFGRHPITNAQENSVKNYINHIIGR